MISDEGGTLMNGISALIREALRASLPLPPHEDTGDICDWE